MADNRLYKVGLTVAGNYVHGTSYDILTQVFYEPDGCSYVSIKPNQNVVPGTDSTVWVKSSARGLQGEPGQPGADGAPGAPGADGAPGAPGEQGEPGVPGINDGPVTVSISNTAGPPSGTGSVSNGVLTLSFSGLKGEKGDEIDPTQLTPEELALIKGPKGDDGKSAYQLAVDGGYEGTQTEWLASLHGEKGDQGIQGIQGEQGIQGVQGATGATQSFSIGIVATGAAGTPASADIAGTAASPVLSLTIPKGDTGATGAKGDKGDSGIGVMYVDTPATPDGTAIITLTDGNTITLDLNHVHTQYVKYVHLQSESEMPVSPLSDTLYLIDEE